MIAFALALCCGAVGGFLAWQHPIAPVAALAAFAVAMAASFVRPRLWLVALPALIPLVSFASWTGWLAIEEIDLLALALAAGAYARLPLAEDRKARPASAVPGGRERPQHLSIVAVAFVTLFALSIAGALYRGIVDAGGLQLGWYDGYYEALNSVRIGKSFALALLFAPLLLVAMREAGARAVNLLAAGFAIGAGFAAMTVVWERKVFTGLLNFSSDYRATGMFWEMHVGGAALDGYLALGLPFVVWAFMRASGRHAVATVVAAGLALLVSYACLATFSRGVYLAVPISLALLFLLVPTSREGASAPRLASLFKAGVAIAAVALASFFVFRAGGYRSLLAVLGVLAAGLQLASVMRGARLIEWATAALVGSVLAFAGVAAGSVVDKGPYFVYALAFTVCYGLTFKNVLTDRPALRDAVTLASYLWLAFCAVHVARHWGGASAQWDSAIVVALLVVLVVARTRSTTPRWPIQLREQGIVVAAAAVIAGSVAVMLGGAYMGERFATSEQDFEGRIQHWRDGLGLLTSPTDWLLGRGLGRFPKSYFFGAPDAGLPGSYRVAAEEGNSYLVLSGPRHPFSFGELFRIAQRVPISPGPYTLSFDARAPVPALLHVEVCEQHLIYNGACAFPSPKITVRGNAWQPYVVTLDGRSLFGGPWYAPRLAFFAFAVEAQGLRVDLDNVSLVGPRGRTLIENGDFGRGTARWFIVSEKIHLPWHIKSLALNVLFDQGVIGLALFVLLAGGTLWRLIAGRARLHPMAPFLAASLVGFLVVGAFDSLLDVPRVALAFYLVLFAGLALEEPLSRNGGVGPLDQRMPSVLLTGGTGFIGSHACVELIAAGWTPVLFDNLCNSSKAVLDRIETIAGRRPPFVEADLRDRAAVDRTLRDFPVEAVIHFAGLKAVGESVADPLRYYENNVAGTLVLVDAMRRHGVDRIVFSSSATVYGMAETMPLSEDAPTGPINAYGRSKLMVEQVLADFVASEPAQRAMLLRYFNPVGAHPSGLMGEDPRGTPNNLMPFVAQVAVGRQPRLRIFGGDYPTSDGTGVRDYIHVVDLAQGHVAALRKLGDPAAERAMVVNLGTGRGHSVLEVVKAFEAASGKAIPYDIVARRPGDVAVCFADVARAHEQLGWRAQRGLDAMCADAWRWQAGNPDGFERS